MRNRRFIRPAQEAVLMPAESVKREDSSSSISERPRRVVTRPKTLIETTELVSAFQLRP